VPARTPLQPTRSNQPAPTSPGIPRGDFGQNRCLTAVQFVGGSVRWGADEFAADEHLEALDREAVQTEVVRHGVGEAGEHGL
jgi:hypothetical protein